MHLSHRLSFGGCVVGLVPADGTAITIPEKYRGFLSQQAPDVVVRVARGTIATGGWGDVVFAPEDSNWRLYARDGETTIVCGPEAEVAPRRQLVLSRDWGHGDLTIADPDPRHFAYPMAYPLDEVLMVRLLARGRGMLLHAFALQLEGEGYLFVGQSGAGKSTLADLWQGEEDVALLSDDRVILRKHDGRFFIYGTPWHGDARALSPGRAPLKRVFVIDHGERNAVSQLSPGEAVTRLFVRSFPPFGDAGGIGFTLDLLADLVTSLPCHELRFVPDHSTVAFVRCVS